MDYMRQLLTTDETSIIRRLSGTDLRKKAAKVFLKVTQNFLSVELKIPSKPRFLEVRLQNKVQYT